VPVVQTPCTRGGGSRGAPRCDSGAKLAQGCPFCFVVFVGLLQVVRIASGFSRRPGGRDWQHGSCLEAPARDLVAFSRSQSTACRV
jgi:hypothetical protein